MKTIYEKRYITEAQAIKAVAKEGLAEGSFEIRKEGKTFQVFEVLHPELAAVAPMSKRQQSEAIITNFQGFIANAKTEAELDELDGAISASAKAGEIGMIAAQGLHGLINGKLIDLMNADLNHIHAKLDAEANAVIEAEHKAASATYEMPEHCPHCNIDLSNGIGHHNQDVNGKPVKHKHFQYACLACGGEFGPAIAKSKVWVHTSTVERPTKLVWHIADEMKAANPSVTRKEVQAECVRRGIASGTARTQYQAWKTANDNAKANAEAAAAASARFNGK